MGYAYVASGHADRMTGVFNTAVWYTWRSWMTGVFDTAIAFEHMCTSYRSGTGMCGVLSTLLLYFGGVAPSWHSGIIMSEVAEVADVAFWRWRHRSLP